MGTMVSKWSPRQSYTLTDKVDFFSSSISQMNILLIRHQRDKKQYVGQVGAQNESKINRSSSQNFEKKSQCVVFLDPVKMFWFVGEREKTLSGSDV